MTQTAAALAEQLPPDAVGPRSAFQRQTGNAPVVPPPATLQVSPDHFDTGWANRPREATLCGLRPLTGYDDDFCRRAAAQYAWQQFPGEIDDQFHDLRTESFNDALMRYAIVRATTDPDDAAKPWGLWQGVGEELVHRALTREGTKALYDRIEAIALATSPTRAEITDAEITELYAEAEEAFARMPGPRAARNRRLLAFVLDDVRALPALTEPPAS